MPTEINLFPFAIILGFLNLRTFYMMWKDKRIAKKNASQTGKGRIPEKKLIRNAFLFGAAGMLLGMQAFRHKTKKTKFNLGVPFALILQIGLVYGLTQHFNLQYFWASPF
ncbi:MAG: DUF1294 domain-containing protein [Bacteroidia bacterium]|nr:DUF1294 domain-containing protein [Bacteroidia bacterium]